MIIGNIMKPNEIIGQFEIFKYQAQKSLCGWLDKELPKLKNNWWQSCILEKVTEEQLKSIREKNISTISGLDFAQLLKILERNWFELSQKHSFSQEHKTYVNALQAARNRWSHKSTNEMLQYPNGISDDDLYRDSDTILRFMQLFDTSSQEALDEIQTFKHFIRYIPQYLTHEIVIICLNCKNELKRKHKYCPFCKHLLHPFCLKCGERLENDWKSCPECKTTSDLDNRLENIQTQIINAAKIREKCPICGVGVIEDVDYDIETDPGPEGYIYYHMCQCFEDIEKIKFNGSLSVDISAPVQKYINELLAKAV